MNKKLKINLVAPLALTATGLLLLAYMIIVEDEPGAVPLLMIIAGAGWLFVSLKKRRIQRTH